MLEKLPKNDQRYKALEDIYVMVEQLYLSDEFEKYNIRMIENVLC